MPSSASSCAEWLFGWWRMAARMSPAFASSRCALWTCRIAVCRTRRKASVCSGSCSTPLRSRSTDESRYAPSERRSACMSAPQALRIRSPSVSCASAYSRCSSVRSALRLGGRLLEDLLQDVHDELHRRVVVVEQHDAEERGLLRLALDTFFDASAGLSVAIAALAHSLRVAHLGSKFPVPGSTFFTSVLSSGSRFHC